MKNRILHLITLIVMILLFTISTHAQDATQEATVEAAPVSVVGEGTTVEDGGVNVTVNNPIPTETPVDSGVSSSFLANIISAILGAIVGGTAALASAASWIKQAMNDPVKMTLAEAAAGSVSKETHERVLGFMETLIAFTKEAVDGVPMVAKPKPETATAPKPNTYPPAVGHDLGTEYTTTSTANLAKTGPLGTGGASTGDGGAFPKS